MAYLKYESKREASKASRRKLVARHFITWALILGVGLAYYFWPQSEAVLEPHNLSLMESTDRIFIMIISFLVYVALMLISHGVSLARDEAKATSAATSTEGKEQPLSWKRVIFMATILSMFLCIGTTWFVESGNRWFADKSTTRTERIVVSKADARIASVRNRGKGDNYTIAIVTPDGKAHSIERTAKPLYFDSLRTGGQYDATVYDGAFGYTVILWFGEEKVSPAE